MALGVRQGTVLQRDTLWSSQGSAFSCGVGQAGRQECPRAGSRRGEGSPLPGVPVTACLPVLFHCACVPASLRTGKREQRPPLSLSAERVESGPQHTRGAQQELRAGLGAWVHEAWMGLSSVAQSCPTLCNPMNRSTPGFPIHHQLPEFTQTHVRQVSDAIQPSHPRSSPSPPAPNHSQHPVSQLFASGGQSIGVSALASVLPMNTQD